MKSRTLKFAVGVVLLAELAAPFWLSAQRPRYTFIDIPTLGGPAATGQGDGPGISQFINNPGVVVGGADTSTAVHAFRWQDGVLTDLGALPGVPSSHAESINARGWATGGAFTTFFDPLIGQPTEHAALWKDSEFVDLGTLGTGLESAALYVNNAGEVVGFSTFDQTPDPNSFLGATIRAFIWKNGVMSEIVPPGSRGSFPAGGCNNQRSDLVAGNDDAGMFLWQNGSFTNIPTLGGTFGSVQCANNQGQVIGGSTLAGDIEQHAFLWSQGALTDLTLGGSFSMAIWLNDAGEAVGGGFTTNDESFHAALWKNGHVTDLGTLAGDCFSIANAVNSRGQVIGQSFSCDFTSRAVVWINGSIIDLNAAIPANSALQLVETDNINDRGEIVGRGLPAGCANPDVCGHVFLLIPCDAAGAQSCQNDADGGGQASPASVKTNADLQKTRQFVARLRARLAQQNHIARFRAPKN